MNTKGGDSTSSYSLCRNSKYFSHSSAVAVGGHGVHGTARSTMASATARVSAITSKKPAKIANPQKTPNMKWKNGFYLSTSSTINNIMKSTGQN